MRWLLVLLLAGCIAPGAPDAPDRALPEGIPAVDTPFGTTAAWDRQACTQPPPSAWPERLVVPHTLGVRALDHAGDGYEEAWEHRPRALRWALWGDEVALLTGSELVVLDADGQARAAVPAFNRSALASMGDHLVVADRGAVEVRDRGLAVVGRVALPQDTPAASAPHALLVSGTRVHVLDNREPPVDALVLDMADPTAPRVAARAGLGGEEALPRLQWLAGDRWHIIVDEEHPTGKATWMVVLDHGATRQERLLLHAAWEADDGTRKEGGVDVRAAAMPWLAFLAGGELHAAHWNDGPALSCVHALGEDPRRPVGLAAWDGGFAVTQDARLRVIGADDALEVDLGPHAWDVLLPAGPY